MTGLRMAALLIAVSVVVAWVDRPVLSARAIWLDDHQYLIDNPLVRDPSWASAARFLSEVRHPSTVAGYYQPLTMISLMLDGAAGGRADSLRPFHRTSLALHVLNTALIVVLLMLLFGEPYTAAMVGLLFGLHPVTVEPLAWIAERKTLLAACFTLAALIAYVGYVGSTAGLAARRAWYAASLACYALAVMSKPTSMPLPVLLLLLDYWPLRRLHRGVLLEKLPFALLGLVAAMVTIFSQQNAALIRYPNEQTPWPILLLVAHNVIFYLHKALWPGEPSVLHLFPDPMRLSHPRVLAGVVGCCVLIPLLLLSLRRTRALLTGWLFFFVAILPTMGVIGVATVVAAEKYLYLPSLGLLMIMAWGLGWCWSYSGGARNRAWVARAAICAAVLALAATEARATRRYLTVWRDSETLYRYVLAQSPRTWWLHYNFGEMLAEEGRMQESADHYLQAAALEPDDFDVQYDLANVMFSLGRKDEAVVHYGNALRLRPADVDVLYNLGVVYADLGRPEDAAAMLRQALRVNPDHVRANHELGLALARQGRPEDAVAYHRKAVTGEPDFVAGRVALADTLQVIGRPEEAIAHYRAALRLDPNDAAVHNNLAVALIEQGMLDEAIAHYREALRLDPTLDNVRVNLSEALAQRDVRRGTR